MNTFNTSRMTHNEQRQQARRIQSCSEYVDSMFATYSKLLVVRCDFYYSMNHPANACLSAESAMSHMDNFLNNCRSYQVFAESLVGHIIRLEYAEQRGYHFHCIFFLNGQQVQSHWFYANQLGQYWIRTLGHAIKRSGFVMNEQESLGSYNICDPDDYERSGTGMVSYADVEKIGVLKADVIAYLLKPGSNVDRGFWKGQLVRSSHQGRSRLYDTGI
jgi:Inovirus Gp2